MILAEVEELMENYTYWLKDKTALRLIGKEWVEITTPYLDRHNDYLQLYAKREEQGFLLTDDGYTITDLHNSGCPIDSPKREELLKTTLAGFGIQCNDNALAQNESAQELMSEDTLMRMAREVAQKLRENLTVDWAVRESVRARMRILIKKLLRKYKYPPDQQP